MNFIGSININAAPARFMTRAGAAFYMALFFYYKEVTKQTVEIWMFGGQLKLAKEQVKGISDICHITVTLYTKAWFTATSIPCIDLSLSRRFTNTRSQNQVISNIAMKKILRYLWYFQGAHCTIIF